MRQTTGRARAAAGDVAAHMRQKRQPGRLTRGNDRYTQMCQVRQTSSRARAAAADVAAQARQVRQTTGRARAPRLTWQPRRARCARPPAVPRSVPRAPGFDALVASEARAARATKKGLISTRATPRCAPRSRGTSARGAQKREQTGRQTRRAPRLDRDVAREATSRPRRAQVRHTSKRVSNLTPYLL